PDGTRILTAESRTVRHGTFDDRDQRAGGSSGGDRPTTARIYDAATGKELVALKGHEGDIRAALFSPDGRRAYTVARAGQLWAAVTGRELPTFDKQWAPAHAAFSPDGRRLFTTGRDAASAGVLRDAATGRQTAQVGPGICYLDFTNTGRDSLD